MMFNVGDKVFIYSDDRRGIQEFRITQKQTVEKPEITTHQYYYTSIKGSESGNSRGHNLGSTAYCAAQLAKKTHQNKIDKIDEDLAAYMESL